MIFSLHEHELKPEVDSAIYEQAIHNALLKIKISGLIKAYQLKGLKGERKNRYSVLWIFENYDVIEKNFGTIDSPKWPADWLYYENEVLAKFITICNVPL